MTPAAEMMLCYCLNLTTVGGEARLLYLLRGGILFRTGLILYQNGEECSQSPLKKRTVFIHIISRKTVQEFIN